MSTNRQRNLWRTAFLSLTVLTLGSECWAAWDGNPRTDPWTDLITTYVPWQVALAVFGALVVWVPTHFWVAYRRAAKRKAVVDMHHKDVDPNKGNDEQLRLF